MSEHICPAGVESPHVTERTYERVPGQVEIHCYCSDCCSGWFEAVAGELPAPPPEPLIVVATDSEEEG